MRRLLMLAALPLLIFTGCRRASDTPVQGYVEGEYVYVSSPMAGRLTELNVARGQRVRINDPLFALDVMPETAAHNQAKSMLTQAMNSLADARKGKRPSEMQATRAQLDQAKASLEFAESEFSRDERLVKTNAVAIRDFDQARANRDLAKHRVTELEGDLQTAELGQRTDQIAAAEAQVDARQADLAQAEWNLSQKRQQAPQDAIVFDTLYRQGEWVPAGHPVVQLLPAPNIKVRAFVPETKIGTFHLGDSVRVMVDGTGAPVVGKISFISPSAEYTPPVIYSQDSREKLVFMVEAVFDPGVAINLHPGQPVDLVAHHKTSMENELAIDVSGMTKKFGSRTVVDHISLQVRSGEIYGFLGPNGSGKTTFIRMLCGLLHADAGSGTCLGHDVIGESEIIKRQVGYMTQRFSFWEDLTIAENLDFVSRMYGIPNRKKIVSEAVDRLGLGDRKNQLAGQLSGGWKQRLAPAACLIHQPRLLLLDEPTAGVDPKARREFWDQIHQLAGEGLTFLITTHYMDEAERCHRLAYIAYGKLLANGTVSQVIDQAGLTTWSVAGPDLWALLRKLRDRPGIEHAVAFGSMLHVSGEDPAAIEKAIAEFRRLPTHGNE